MPEPPLLLFGDFRMDLADERLWREDKHVQLTPKTFAMLRCLIERAGRLVTKEELLAAVWPDTVVSESVLTNCMRELRRALGDQARAPEFIETVHRRGYRFLVSVTRPPRDADRHPEHVSEIEELVPEQQTEPPFEMPIPDAEEDSSPSPPSSLSFEGSRRQLTIMSCHWVGSAELSAQLDPEDFRDILRTYHVASAAVIERFDGYIAQYLGDGLLVYFGYPNAHEDDAQRAIRAGLALVEAMAELNAELSLEQEAGLMAQFGIHTGLVVVEESGRGSHQEPLAIGESPTVATRLAELAAPGTVLISGATAPLVQGYFEWDPIEPQMLSGVPGLADAYQVLRNSGAHSRLEAAPALTPLVGREAEMVFLLDRWELVQAGQGQAVLLIGEPGIGKSRLAQGLKGHMVDQYDAFLECRSSPYYQHTALYPVIDLLEREANVHSDDPPDVTLNKLEQVLDQFHVPLEDTVPLFATLLSLPMPEHRYQPRAFAPQQLRQQTLETMVAMVLARAEQQPLLFIVEDLHWTDPTTLEFLDLLLAQTPTSSLLVLLTCRPEFQVPWSQRRSLTWVTLNRLSNPQVKEVIACLTDRHALPEEMLLQVIEKTDGVPLFIEEMIKALIESGALDLSEGRDPRSAPSPTLAIPATLQDTLMARLDRLPTAKRTAQIGATIGRQFTYELIRDVVGDEVALRRELGLLVEAELIYQRGLPPHSTYTFKHALIQDAAYRSLLRRQRESLHLTVARVLETQFPMLVGTEPEVVAHHYTEAGCPEQAIPYWQRASQHASERSAYLEAIDHLRKALAQLGELPETSERDAHEILLQTNLGSALSATQGYEAPEVSVAYGRALALCGQVGEIPQIFPVLRGLALFYSFRGEMPIAISLGQQILHLAERHEDPDMRVAAHLVLGGCRAFIGELNQGESLLEEGIAYYHPSHRRSHQLHAGTDSGVACLTTLAQVKWMLGFADQADQCLRDAIALANSLDHPFSKAYAQFHSALVRLYCRQGQAAEQHLQEVLTLSHAHRFQVWIAGATCLRGSALAQLGDVEAGISQLHQGMSVFRELSAPPVFWILLHFFLAEAYSQAHQPAKGLRQLDEALALVGEAEGGWFQPEFCRLQGKLLLGRSAEHEADAEACFQKAFEIAGHQQARALELRAATSLARLWQSQGKRQEARELLAPIYDRFTEGFDTADLQEAAALLEALQG